MFRQSSRRRAHRSTFAQASLRRATRSIIESLEARQLLSASDISLQFSDGLLGSAHDVPTATLRQGDKVVVALTQFSSDNVVLARFDSAGQLDSSFGNGGSLAVDFGGLDVIHALTLDNNGNILAAGGTGDLSGAQSMVVARFTANGQLDSNFSGDGIQTIAFAQPAEGYAIAVAGDDTIAVAGNVTSDFGRSIALAELGDNGALQGGFGDGGTQITSLYLANDNSDPANLLDATANAVIFSGNANIIVGGQSVSGQLTSFTLAEYDAGTGQLNADFDGDGITVTDFVDHNSSVVALAADATTVTAIGNAAGVGIARYTLADGQVDPTFNSGVVFEDGSFGLNNITAGNVVGGQVYVAGIVDDGSGPKLGAVRYHFENQNQTGGLAIDADYGTSGVAATAVDASVLIFGAPVGYVAADGSIATAATAFTFSQGSDVAAGAIDADGVNTANAQADFKLPALDQATTLNVLDAAGSTLIGGYTFSPLGQKHGFISRRLASGAADQSFGNNGTVTIDLGTGFEGVTSVAVASNGDIYVALRTANGASVLRYAADGSLVTTFGNSGQLDVAPPITGDNVEIGLNGGTLAVAGTTAGASSDDFFLATFDADSGAAVSTDVRDLGTDSSDALGALLVLDDGSIILGGSSNGDFALIKYDAAGNFDSAFGVVTINLGGNDAVNALAQSGGSIIAAGASDNLVAVATLTTSGGSGGFAPQTLALDTQGGASGVAVDSGGNILLSTTLNGPSRTFGVVRLTSAGVLDAAFAPGGVSNYSFNAGNADAAAIALAGDGRIFVAGTTDTGSNAFNRDFAVTVLNGEPANSAPVASITGPAEVNVNNAVTYNGSFIDSGDVAAHTYLWTITGPGGFSATGTNPSITFTPTTGGTYSIALTVTDSGGLSDTASTSLNVNTAPTASISGPANANVNNAVTYNGSFADAGDVATHTFLWTVSGPSGFSTTSTDPDITFTPTAGGAYSITLTVTDSGGLSDTASTSLNVNTAPTASISGPASANVNNAVTYNGSFSDAGDVAIHTYLWTVSGPGGFSASGTNANITFTPAAGGAYSITLTVTDSGGLSDIKSTSLNVNAAPTASIVGPTSATTGTSLTYTANFTDPGDAAAHTYLWTVTGPGGFSASGTSSTISFTPASAGAFTVSLTVTDSGGLSGSVSLALTVNPVVSSPVTLVSGVLTINSDAAANTINIASSGGQYIVTLDGHNYAFPAAGVTSILLNAGDGADLITLANSVNVPATIHGGAGNDTITGGSGNDLLFGDDGNDIITGGNGDDVFIGGNGNDKISGGNGRDVLIGGDGSDTITGDNGDDLLISGYTSHDTDTVALSAIRALWTGIGAYDARVSALSATLLTPADLYDDHLVDYLSGNNGKDWFIANIDGSNKDIFTDLEKKEVTTDMI